jgi:hypothetical protein
MVLAVLAASWPARPSARVAKIGFLLTASAFPTSSVCVCALASILKFSRDFESENEPG